MGIYQKQSQPSIFSTHTCGEEIVRALLAFDLPCPQQHSKGGFSRFDGRHLDKVLEKQNTKMIETQIYACQKVMSSKVAT